MSPELETAIGNFLVSDNFGLIIVFTGFALLLHLVWTAIIKPHHTPSPSPISSTKPPRHGLPPQPALRASDHHSDGKRHLLLAATGSVATIKIPNIIRALSHHPDLSIRLLLTPAAAEFLRDQSPEQPALPRIAALPNVAGVYLDEDEWAPPWTRGAPILHIELRRWADVMLVAPCSANALARIGGGVSDGLVYSVARAWDTTGRIDGQGRGEGRGMAAVGAGRKKILVAPAMNTAMWNHPVTATHVGVLEGWEAEGWMEILRPVEKDLACGDVGGGAMREWTEIVTVVEQRLGLQGGGADVT